ncbi:hypothetical protein M0R45_019688 [Rubus argutus]|uniref:Uncharacterized protein n=1 Tax=Rubus argutus TaxID=59490 RepID=A0AAW1X6K1_RUBAR
MSQWMTTFGEGRKMEWWWKVYGCSVWDVWKIFREGMRVRFGVESGENGRTKRADVPDVRADWTSRRESPLLWWSSDGGPAVLPPLVEVVCRKNRRKCNFFIFLPFFDSSRLLMATSSEGKFMQSSMSRSHG